MAAKQLEGMEYLESIPRRVVTVLVEAHPAPTVRRCRIAVGVRCSLVAELVGGVVEMPRLVRVDRKLTAGADRAPCAGLP